MEYLYICRWFTSQISPEPGEKCLWHLASELSCFLSSHRLLLSFHPNRDSHHGAELGATSFSPSPLTQKSLSKGLPQKWMPHYWLSTCWVTSNTSERRRVCQEIQRDKGLGCSVVGRDFYVYQKHTSLCSTDSLISLSGSQNILKFVTVLRGSTQRVSFRARLYLSWLSDFPDLHFIQFFLSLPSCSVVKSSHPHSLHSPLHEFTSSSKSVRTLGASTLIFTVLT